MRSRRGPECLGVRASRPPVVAFVVMNDGRWNMVNHGFDAVYGKVPPGLPQMRADLATVAEGFGAVGVRGTSLADYARGGAAAEAMWITAQRLEMAVQPISPVFLYALQPVELAQLSPPYAADLQRLQAEFRKVFDYPDNETLVLVIRLFNGPQPTVRSRRRGDTVHRSAQ